jgi:hypothetical protein
MGFFDKWVVCLGVEVCTGSICCDVWVVGWVSRSPIDDVSRNFPKFVIGSFFESFGVSPSGELLGFGEGRYPLFHIKTGGGCDKGHNQEVTRDSAQ